MTTVAAVENRQPPAARRRAGGLAWHLRCIAAVVTTYLVGNEVFLRLIGVINRWVLRGGITGVFLLYPARKEYADALAYRWHQRQFAWHPALVGLYRQNGRRGLIFGIPDLEDDLRLAGNGDNVLDLQKRMERIRSLVGADRKIFAGILPSLFMRLNAPDAQLEQQRDLTARAVMSALDQVSKLYAHDRTTPILLIGGRGYIATSVLALCAGRNVRSIDQGEFDVFRQIANEQRGGPLMVINLAKSGALSEYADHFWPGVVVLNEVYPEPSGDELAALERAGAVCFHVVGVAGSAWPAFPRAYRRGIPCCAALPAPGDTEVTAIVTRLGAGKPGDPAAVVRKST